MDEHDRRLGAAEKNIIELFREVKDLDGTRRETKIVLENLNATMQELKEAVKGLTGKPAQLWDKLLYALIAALVSAATAYFIGG